MSERGGGLVRAWNWVRKKKLRGVLAFLLSGMVAYFAVVSGLYAVCSLGVVVQIRIADAWLSGSSRVENKDGSVTLWQRPIPVDRWTMLVAEMEKARRSDGGSRLVYRALSGELAVITLGFTIPPDLHETSINSREVEWLTELGVGAKRGYWAFLLCRYPWRGGDMAAGDTRHISVDGTKVIFCFDGEEPALFFAAGSSGSLHRVAHVLAEDEWLVSYSYPSTGRLPLWGPDGLVSPALSTYCRELCERDALVVERALSQGGGIMENPSLLNPLSRLRVPGFLGRLAGYSYVYPEGM